MTNLMCYLMFLFFSSVGLPLVQLPVSKSNPLFKSVRTDTTVFSRYKLRYFGGGSITFRDPLLAQLSYKGLSLKYESNPYRYRPFFLAHGRPSFTFNSSTNDFTNPYISETGLFSEISRYLKSLDYLPTWITRIFFDILNHINCLHPWLLKWWFSHWSILNYNYWLILPFEELILGLQFSGYSYGFLHL